MLGSASVKRTVLWDCGFDFAAVKSGVREGLFGVARVVEEEDARSNCEVRSASWVRRRGSWEVMDSSGLSWTCDSSDSIPERNCSSEREIWPSWLFGERFREMARCRSSNESLMWSASRKSCGGFVDMLGVVGRMQRSEEGTMRRSLELDN